jgi:peptidyl-prolyl cis-trans isomerase SurA
LKFLKFAPLALGLVLAPGAFATASAAPPAASPSPAAQAPAAQSLDGIAAIVNDDLVLRSEVEEQLGLFINNNHLTPDSAEVDTLRSQILDQLINEKLLVAEAKREGLSATSAEIDKQVDQAITEAKQRFGSEDAYQQALLKENLTEAKLREKFHGDLERQILVDRLKRKQFPHKPVSQAEAEAFFKEHPDRFPPFPAQVRLAVIQIPVTPDSAALARAKSSALAARKRILAGEKFAKVAAQVSEDAGSSQAGGDLGFFTRGTMEPEFEKYAFSAKLNTLSPPIQTPFGWHLIEVLDRDTVKTVTHRDSLDRDGKPLLEAHVRHILFRVPLTNDDADRALALAERVRDEALRGADFATLVKRYSKYEGQQGEGGDVGFVSLASLQPPIRAGLDSLEVGQLSQPLANQVGYNVFKVLDRQAERPYTLEEIKSDLPQVVEELKQREQYDAWIKELRSHAHIEIRNG